MHALRSATALFAGFWLVASLVALKADPVWSGRWAAQIGQVGVNLGVLPNQFNAINQALTEKERDIMLREELLSERESWFAAQQAKREAQDRNAFLYASVGGGVITLLVILTLYFDYEIWQMERRKKEGSPHAA